MSPAAPPRRPLLFVALALAVGIPVLACGGGPDVPEVVVAPPDEAARLVGRWQLKPDPETVRMLKVIDAAISGRKDKRKNLGQFTDDEQRLFEQWEGKKGEDIKVVKGRIRFASGVDVEFAQDRQVTLRFADGKSKASTFGPVPYEVVEAATDQVTVRFDPGLGNGPETHTIVWRSETEGLDTVTVEGQEPFPLLLERK